jgi:hypothetical protein
VLNYHCLCHCSYICLQFLIVTTYKVIYKASPCRALYAPRRLEGVCRLALRTMILWYNFVVHFEQNTAANTVSFVSTCRNLFSSSKVTALYSIEMAMGLINANPIIHEKKERRIRQAPETTDENAVESIDQLEIFDILLNDFPYINVVKLAFSFICESSILAIWLLRSLTFLHHIRDIKDPEHPYSLEQLNVVTEDSIELNDESNHVR